MPEATIWEADPGLFGFWKAALEQPDDLIRLVSSADVTLATFDECRENLANVIDPQSDIVSNGFSFLFLNRTSYSGIVGAGPIGGRLQNSAYSIDCRFNKIRIIEQIRQISALSGKLSIQYGDGIKSVEAADPDSFLYVDPPYFSNGKKFYKKYFCTLDHYRLRRSLRMTRGKWLLSYDYDRKVEYLYRDFPTSQISLYHSARASGRKQEIIVSPMGFADILYDAGIARMDASHG